VSATSGGTTTNGGLLFPAYNQTLTYDLDGNLSFDGIWTYQWDCENRLAAMSMTNVAGVANSNRLRLEFAYDYQGRRGSKTVKSWNGGTFTNAVTTRFVYDLSAEGAGGWNLVASLDPQSSLLQAFLWGQDVSGTEDGAGGIGGLVAVCETSGGQISNCHFAAYDGNGNVTALVRASDSLPSALYEYSPYGETLRLTGPMAKTNPFRFSSKFADPESGLEYYGFRYYDPVLGRWASRDPIAEQGGPNLYAFVSNSPVDAVDPFGHITFIDILIGAAEENGEKAVDAAKGLSITSRIRQVANALNAIESFKEGVLEAKDMLGTDGIEMLTKLERFRAEQAQGLKGYKTLRFAETQNHHMFSQAFRKFFNRVKVNGKSFNINKFKVRISEVLHQACLHGNAGGPYNQLWETFTSEKGQRIKSDPFFMIGFGFGLLDQLGFGDLMIK
jgi:RHS repeat-associated protein